MEKPLKTRPANWGHLSALTSENERLREELKRLREACSKANEEICQTLGQALGYPWYKDSPDIFPDATEEHGVCVGDHVAETLAMEAAERIKLLSEKLKTVIDS